MATISDSSLERIFKALANRRRIALLRILKGRKEVSVGDLADGIKLSFKATSKHLTVLAAAGFVEREQRSLNMYYSIPKQLDAAARAALVIL